MCIGVWTCKFIECQYFPFILVKTAPLHLRASRRCSQDRHLWPPHKWSENDQCINIFSIIWDVSRNVPHCYQMLSHILTCASQMMAAHNFKICYSGNKTWNQVLYNLSLKQAWPNFTFKWLSVHLLLSNWPYLALGSLALSWRTMSAPDKHLVFENIHSSPTWGRLGNIQFCPWSLSGTSLLRMTTIMQFRCKGKLLCSAAINSPIGSK